MPSAELETVIEMLRSRPAPAGLSPDAMRARFEEETARLPLPPDVGRSPVDAGGVPAEWVDTPGAVRDRVLLYLHGGGYVVGSPRTHAGLAARIGQAAGARVLVPDYRLAPEHPFPAALEDATAAYRWLLAQGHEPARLAVAGDSAGGGLAVATLVSLRDAGEPLPAAAVCLSPWTDLTARGPELERRAANDPIIQPQGLVAMAEAYAGEADPHEALISPVYAELRGLPPLLIQVGTAETLLDDARRLADSAREAGVEVAYEPWEGMIHVWQFFAPLLPEGRAAIDAVGAFLRKHWG